MPAEPTINVLPDGSCCPIYSLAALPRASTAGNPAVRLAHLAAAVAVAQSDSEARAGRTYPACVGAAPDDWRRRSQQHYLPAGTEFVWETYRARSGQDEHEHCEFCWAKFMDPSFSEEHRTYIAAHPDVLIAGFTTTKAHAHGAGYHWVCEKCMADFADEFGWHVAAR